MTRRDGYFTFVKSPERDYLIKGAERAIVGEVNREADIGVNALLHIALTFFVLNFHLIERVRPRWRDAMVEMMRNFPPVEQRPKGQYMFTKTPLRIMLINTAGQLARMGDRPWAAVMDFALLFLILNWEYVSQINPRWHEDTEQLRTLLEGA